MAAWARARAETSGRGIAVGALLLLLSGCASRAGAGRPPLASAAAAGGPTERGEALLREGRLDEAERSLRDGAAGAPRDSRPLVGLAQVHFARRDVAGAIALLDQARALGETAQLLRLRGRYRGVARRFDEAAADLSRAAELDPREGETWCALAAIQIARGDEWEARWAYSRAREVMERRAAVDRVWTLLLSMPPDPAQPQEALDRCSRGRASALDGRWDEAHHELLNGLRKASRFEWCIAALAESVWRLGEPERAEGILRRLDASYGAAHPELRADAKGKLAELLLERGKAAEAAQLARDALAVRPERALLLDVLARGCDAQGDADCARDAWTRLLARPHLPAEVGARAESRRRAPDGGGPAAAAGAQSAEPLLRVLKDGRWGFVDLRGKPVIPPRYDHAEPFSEGLAAVRVGDRQGYVDATGELVLVPKFEPAGVFPRPFVNGLAAVRVGQRFGYMARDGTLAIDARFASAEDFSEGYALTCAAGAGCGYIDRAGRGAIGPGFMGGAPVRSGVACATLQMGMSRVRVALVRTDGSRLPGEYDGCGSLSEGLVAVRTGDRWGYLDAAGRGVIPPRWGWAGDFAEGLAPAKDERGLCGFIDRAGSYAIAPAFRECAAFSGGLARVDLARAEADAERWGFVDRTGRVVIDGGAQASPFDTATDFAGGVAAVGVGGNPLLAGTGPLLGYIDAAGRWIWPPTR